LVNLVAIAEGEPSSKDVIRLSPLVKFCEVKDVLSDEFKEAMRIYINTFPENVRRPVAFIEMEVKGDKTRLIIGRIDNKIVSMALLRPLKGTSFVLGDYLAIREEYRSQGIGEHFLKNIFSIIDDIQFEYLLGEVESPYIEQDKSKMRRVNFFKRLGMKELKDVRYILPPLQGTSPTEMILMVFCKTKENRLIGDEVRNIIIRIFSEIYNRDEDDEILASNLKGIPDLIRLI
jgi:N-acetylglutamate synthase-like GNAT family acetyltransferase